MTPKDVLRLFTKPSNMNGKGKLAIIMSWSCENYVSEYTDPDDLIYETSGNLFAIDENDDKERIGKVRIYYVDVERAINERESIFDVLRSTFKR